MGKWLKIIGIVSALAFPLSLVFYRLGLIPFRSGFMAIQYGAMIGAAVFVIGVLFYLIRRKADPMGAKSAIVGALIAVLPLLPLVLQAKKGRSLPVIHNVSTDTLNAPMFDKIAAIRSDKDNTHAYDRDQQVGESGKLGELQLAAYPDVKTHISSLSPTDALLKAEKVANELGWEIVNIDKAKGILEATDTTLLWAFKDDVVVRITEKDGQTHVDLRSVSRIGRSDLGANAERILAFLEQI